ncbi:MAG: hypothetical protein IKI93_11295 [Clostridia bacterium]|nr:hypothetical protein [Clostridia bacterium]
MTCKTGDGNEVHYDPKPDFFEVDELIAVPLQILNRKGYLTACSCAGHPFDPVFMDRSEDGDWEPFCAEGFLRCISYVTFFGEYDFPTLPEGFVKDRAAAGIRISREHVKDGDYWKTLCSVMDAMKSLHDWAEGLPDLDSSAK